MVVKCHFTMKVIELGIFMCPLESELFVVDFAVGGDFRFGEGAIVDA